MLREGCCWKASLRGCAVFFRENSLSWTKNVGEAGKGSGDGPRYAVARSGATARATFREQSGMLVVTWTSCALLFCPHVRMGKSRPGLLPVRASQSVSRSAKTRVFRNQNVAQRNSMTTMWRGLGDSSRFAARPLAPLTSAPPSRAAYVLLAAAGSRDSSRLRVGQGSGDSSHLGVPSSGMAFLPASMRSQHLLRWNLNLHLWIPRFIPVTIKKPNRTGAIRQKGIRLLSEGELCHRYQHLACKVAS